MQAQQSQPTSTRQVESSVIPAKIEDLWPLVRNLAFDKLMPSKVKKVEYKEGQAGQLECVAQIHYNDATWTVRVVELSDLNYCLVYEVVEADPPAHVASIINTIRLQRVTDTNETFFLWSTQFSSDVTLNSIQDNKYKKQDYFSEIKKNFTVKK